MSGATEDTDEDEFGGDLGNVSEGLEVQRTGLTYVAEYSCCYEESWQGDGVCDELHLVSC